jgi:membrane protease YdiL (CAAX protease family)
VTSGDKMLIGKKKIVVFIVIQLLIAQAVTKLMNGYSISASGDAISFFVSFCFYIVIFILPVIAYLRFVDKANALTYLKLDKNIFKGIAQGILIGSLIFLVFLLKSKNHAIRHINLKTDIFIILGRIIVGPLEEIPFRGFYMQKFKDSMSFPMANMLASILFAFTHINLISGSITNSIFSVLYIMVIGLWMGYIFEKTQSLWSVSIIHSMYDIAVWLLL